MKTIVWKELRENIKWALLLAVALGAGLFYSLYQTEYGQPDYYFNKGVTLCKTTFLMVTTFGFAAVGLLLGLVQILPELGRDRWAALLHRPAPRGVIFGGKALAGVILYFIAAGLPFLAAIYWVATPGHFFSPFVPEMVLPGVADLLVGLAFYGAALLTGLQTGGHFLLRVLPIFAAVFAAFYAQNQKFFYVAAEAAVLMAAGLTLAAWGAMQNQQILSVRPWLSRAAFLGIIFYGVCGVGELGKVILKTFLPAPKDKWIRYEITDVGVPVKLTSLDGTVLEVQDLEGKPVTDSKYGPKGIQNHDAPFNTLSLYIGDSHGWKSRSYQDGYRESRKYLWAYSVYQFPRTELWFNLVKDHSLIGFLPNKLEAFARFGADGFAPVTAPAKPFPAGMEFESFTQGLYVWYGRDWARLVNMGRQSIKELALPEASPIFGSGQSWAYSDAGTISYTGLALQKGVAVYDIKGDRVTYLPYQRDVDRWGEISLGVNRDGKSFFLQYDPSAWIDGKKRQTMPSYLDVVDFQGKVLRSYEMPQLPAYRWLPGIDKILGERLQSPLLYFGTMAYQKIGALLGSERLQKSLAWQFGGNLKKTQEVSLWVSGISALCAIGAYFLARRGQLSRRSVWAWSLFVFAFGLGGLIPFCLAAGWPALARCPACGKGRRIEDEQCAHCGAGWPAPPDDGTEIMEPKTAQPVLAQA